MRTFFKFTFATILGLFLFCFFSILILAVIGSASSSGEPDVKDNSILKISLNKPFAERDREEPFGDLEIPGNDGGVIGLYDLKKSIKHARALSAKNTPIGAHDGDCGTWHAQPR